MVLYSIVLSSMMLFRRSFGLTNTIAYLIAFVDFNSSNYDRKGQSYPVEYYLELVEEYSESKIHKKEPESGNGNVNTLYFVNQAREILESVARSLFTMNEQAIANV